MGPSRLAAQKTITAFSLYLLLFSGWSLAQEGASVAVSSFLDKSTLARAGSELGAEATVSNSRATFDVDGASVTGTVSMLERINELQAVATLNAMKKTDVYVDAVKNSAKAPINYGKSLVNEPVDTVSNTVKGLGGFLADVGYSVVSDDPSQENVAKTGLGHATAKRKFAFQLGVNPYSRYEPLQDALNEVSWAATGGGLTVGAAFRAVKNTPGSVLTTTRIANTGRVMVRDNSPRKLKNLNEEKLLAMGVRQSLVDAQLDNYNYDPEAETRLVTSLASMEGVSGRADMISRSSLATSHRAADEMRDWVELLAAWHEQVKPAVAIVIVDAVPMLVDKNGSAHGIFPTDYVRMTDDTGVAIRNITAAVKAAGYAPGSIYVTGKIDPAVRKILTESGWTEVKDYAGKILRSAS
ncbi:MAG: hypothetical protein ABJ308_11955 [Halieaceae bacterium]